MYEAFFKLQNRPFVSAPQTKTYFPAAVTENARQTLTRLIARGEGPGLIIGPPGTGKSLLCQLLSDQFQDQFAVVVLSCGRLKTSQAMLRTILHALGLPCRGVDEGEMRLSLMDYLQPRADGRAGLLLLVDEAHTLSWRLLDEIRMLTNLVRDGQSRVRVVLAGGPVLEERFASPKMESFSQRLAGRCYLEPLDGVETSSYVRAQLAAAGGDPATLIDKEALRSIYRASDGIPRLINQICDHALILATAGGHPRLTSEVIDEAWADLQQLPPPWTPGVAEDSSSQVVEFGQLDDDSESPDAIPFRGAMTSVEPRPTGTPDEQLEAIETQLADLESDSSSITARGTEVELDFPEFGDPFSEEFAEEEVVVESYTSDVEIFADVPRVSSWEGQQLGSLLEEIDTEPWTTGSPSAAFKISDACVEEAMPAEPTAQNTAWAFSPALDPVLPEELTDEGSPPATSNASAAACDNTSAFTARPSLDKLAGGTNDRDVIIVEDDTPGAALPASHSPAHARKGEFRQLFAKLRRG